MQYEPILVACRTVGLYLRTHRSTIARRAELYCIIPGEHVHLSDEGNNSLYIILSGSVKIEVSWKPTQNSNTIKKGTRSFT